MSKYFIVIAVLAVVLKFNSNPQESFKHENLVKSSSPPKFWFFTILNTTHMFESIEKILLKLGLEKIEVNATSTETLHVDWDFLWSYDYIWHIPLNYSALKKHQKINHIPGMPYVTSKSHLAMFTNSKYVPKGFTDMKSLKEFAEENPSVKFVQKMNSNRGVSLKNASEIEFGTGLEGSFAQIFIENPLLIAGHKFDFNIYIAITSVDPLRVYYYGKDSHLRFCKLPYDPKNFTDSGTYVIGDEYFSAKKFPKIQKYLNNSYSRKDAFEEIMKEKGLDTKIIYDQIEDCIRSIFMSKEQFFIQEIAKLAPTFGKLHFFELVRFDFLIDESLKLHLMEVNMSPNFYSRPSKDVGILQHLHETVIYNFLNLVGVGSYLKKNHIQTFKDDEEDFLCHVNSLTVSPKVCMKNICQESCDLPECELCWNCLSSNLKMDMKNSYMEHLNIGEMKRVVPPSVVSFFPSIFVQLKT